MGTLLDHFRVVRMLTACLLALGLLSAPADAAAPRVTLNAPSQITAGTPAKVTVRIARVVRKANVRLEWRRSGRWQSSAPASLRRSTTLQLKVGVTGRIQVRAVVKVGKRVIARSSARRITVVAPVRPSPVAPLPLPLVPPTVAPAPTPTPTPEPATVSGEGYSYTVPSTTKVYGAADVTNARPGAVADEAELTLAPGAAAPAPGGHAMIAPTAQLPRGMFAAIRSVAPQPDGTTTVVVGQASITEVLDDVHIDFKGPDHPADSSMGTGRRVATDQRAREAARQRVIRRRRRPPSECTKTGSDLSRRPASELWNVGRLVLPVELSVRESARRAVLRLADAARCVSASAGTRSSRSPSRRSKGFKCNLIRWREARLPPAEHRAGPGHDRVRAGVRVRGVGRSDS